MRWSVPIGRVLGITLRLHVTFLLLLAVLGYVGFVESGVAGAGWILLFVCSVFACIGLHELGHSVVAQQLGVSVKSITLLPIGGVAALRNMPEYPWHEIAITLAGPLVNAVIAVALLPFTGWPAHFFIVAIPHNLAGLMLALVQANLTLFFFNFIPAFPMDGGRLLRAILALAFSYQRATAIAATVGQVLAVGFVLVGFKASLFLVIIGAFIFISAEGEEKLVRTRGLMRNLRVADVMNQHAATVAPTAPVAVALEKVYQTGQDDFPVMDGEHLVGVLTRSDMLHALHEHGRETPVGDVMDTDVPTTAPAAMLTDVYDQMLAEGSVSFPVIAEGRLVGLLSPENINRYILLHSSLKPSRRWWRNAAATTPTPPPVIADVPPVVTPPPRAESVPPSGPA